MRIPSLVALTCKEVVELVSEYMHEELETGDRARFEQHLHACTWCMTYLDQMRRTVALASALGKQRSASGLGADVSGSQAKLLEVFRSWKQDRS